MSSGKNQVYTECLRNPCLEDRTEEEKLKDETREMAREAGGKPRERLLPSQRKKVSQGENSIVKCCLPVKKTKTQR